MTKYDKIDWKKIQDAHNDGMSWNTITKTFSVCNAALAWGRKNGKLHFRSNSESLKLVHSLGKVDYSVYRTKSFRKKMAKNGGYKENSGRCAHLTYLKKDGKEIKIQGTWELKLAKFLDSIGIKWEKNRLGYKYLFEGKEKTYFPDFVLPDIDVYIEVKGYQTSKDDSKWSQFPKKLLIVKRKDINDLDFWFENNLRSRSH